MTPPCVVPTFRPYAAENLEFGGFYASSCESRVSKRSMPFDRSRLFRASLNDGKGTRLGRGPKAQGETDRVFASDPSVNSFPVRDV